MSRITLILLVFAIACGVIGGFVISQINKIPERIEKNIVLNLNALGFDFVKIGYKKSQENKVVLHDVSLDSDKFSKIKKITVEYSLFDFLIKQNVENIEIEDMKIMSILNDDFSFDITNYNFTPKLSFISLPPKINFKNTSLDMFTNYGGVRVTGDINFQLKDDKTAYNIQSNLKSKQKLLAFSSNIQATLGVNGEWHIDVAFEDVKTNLNTHKVSRASMNIVSDGESFDNFFTKGEIVIPSASFYDLNIQNIFGTLEFTSAHLDIIMAGKFRKSPETRVHINYTTRNPENIHSSWSLNSVDSFNDIINGTALETTNWEIATDIERIDTVISLPVHKILSDQKDVNIFVRTKPYSSQQQTIRFE